MTAIKPTDSTLHGKNITRDTLVLHNCSPSILYPGIYNCKEGTVFCNNKAQSPYAHPPTHYQKTNCTCKINYAPKQNPKKPVVCTIS